MKIIISQLTLKEISKEQICERDILQCFENTVGKYFKMEDMSDDLSSGIEMLWFISETNRMRKLKVVFTLQDGCIHIKSASATSDEFFRIYERDYCVG